MPSNASRHFDTPPLITHLPASTIAPFSKTASNPAVTRSSASASSPSSSNSVHDEGDHRHPDAIVTTPVKTLTGIETISPHRFPQQKSTPSPSSSTINRKAGPHPSSEQAPVTIISSVSRKQNSACDTCRSRKVKCNKLSGESKCIYCKNKGIECTTMYVEWATSASKRTNRRPYKKTKLENTPASSDASGLDEIDPGQVALLPHPLGQGGPHPGVKNADPVGRPIIDFLFRREAEYVGVIPKLSYYSSVPSSALPPVPKQGPSRPIGHRINPSTTAELRLLDTTLRDEFVSDLIETYFSVVHIRIPFVNPHVFKKRYHERSPELGGPPADVLVAVVIAFGAKFSENPIVVADREESARELQRAYDSAQAALSRGERAKAAAITGAKGGVDLPILTLPSKYREKGCSRIAKDLVLKAQEALEKNKAYRIATLENIQACLLIECIFFLPPTLVKEGMPRSHSVNLFGGGASGQPDLPFSKGFWFMSAIRMLLELKLNLKETVMAIKDADVRGEVIFAWWMACLSDAASSAFFRRKPLIRRHDYTSDPPAGNPSSNAEAPSPLLSLDAYLAWYESVHETAEIHRMLADVFWIPTRARDGVEFSTVEAIVKRIERWKANHLHKVGVPTPSWPSHWDYIAAVTACCSDISFHILWIMVFEAIDEFGIRGTDRSEASCLEGNKPLATLSSVQRSVSESTTTHPSPEPDLNQVNLLKVKVEDAALSGALRVAALTDVLSTNGYLRLDPNLMLAPLEIAAKHLARFQRSSEVEIMVSGLRQYAISYESLYQTADEIESMAKDYVEFGKRFPEMRKGARLPKGWVREQSFGFGGVGPDGNGHWNGNGTHDPYKAYHKADRGGEEEGSTQQHDASSLSPSLPSTTRTTT
ncbi:hypothetical protein IE53DRAFT_362612 [Violaceomyces palustris]|uniref:Uncharacterized protein n=1 Tax=Violaceomyces palustris TaxID=1673888 RepID=A0ACD0NWD4_9BASI|nr:hypothetical protein IE53DRAFT_362612 [Violaceomyces palustris]